MLLRTWKEGNPRIFLAIYTILVLVGAGTIVRYAFSRHGDGIETRKVYALAYSYKATLATFKGGVPARVFDFADRSLPRTSVVVPLYDGRGMPLVRENTSLPSSTVRKVVGSVPTSVVEGVTYPGYTYTLWEYHLGVTGPQSVVPVVTPSALSAK